MTSRRSPVGQQVGGGWPRWQMLMALSAAVGVGVAVLPAGAQQGRESPPRLVGSGLPSSAVRQIEALMAEKAGRTIAQQKVASQLLDARRISRGLPVADGVTIAHSPVAVGRDGRVEVDIRADVTPGVVARIADLRGTVVNSVPAHRGIRARLPLDAVETLAALDEVHTIGVADQMITWGRQGEGATRRVDADAPVGNKDDTSEGDTAHAAASARTTYGVDGTGIGIGVLSDGVDTLASRQATGDLPGTVTVLSGQAGAGDEGTAMLEIVFDLAPGADLYFATALGGQPQFAANVEALCTAGADVIVDDVFYFFEAVFQDGIVASGVNNATANGCFHFSSAGNAGNLNDGTSGVWEGDYVAAGSTPAGVVSGTAHDFGAGANSNLITADGLGFSLQWADPLGGSANDYDLYLFNNALTTLLDFSTSTQNGAQDPREFICSSGTGCNFNDTNNRLVVVKNAGAADRFLHLNTVRGRLGIATAGQTSGHGAADNAIGVAASAAGAAAGGGGVFNGTESVETFSSDGPRRIFFEPSGTAVTPGDFSSSGGEVLNKPDLTAADCVSTATPGFGTFCGTSAAAPHAAAIAALMLESAGGPAALSLVGLRSRMFASTLDIEGAGLDRDAGHGILMATTGVVNAQPMSFTDDPVVAGTTPVKLVHLSELRSRINLLRIACGLGNAGWTDPSPVAGVTTAKAIHVAELRTALNAAYTACGQTPPTYTDPTLTAGSTVIKAVHITEIRAGVTALE